MAWSCAHAFPYRRLRCALAGTVFLFAFAAEGALAQGTAPASPTADDLAIVDCRLPGRVRKLGTSMVYQMAGSLIRTSARDCSIRGGEYTILDRSRYADAIKLWLPQAQSGDVAAQTNVGILYEKLVPPDYAAAAAWYAKAADAGYGPAQTALGHLYESGLGVAKDPVKALNLYRRAAGLSDKTLAFVTSAQPEQAGSGNPAEDEKLRRLRDQLQKKQREIDELRRSLKQKQSSDVPPHGANSSSEANGARNAAAKERRIAELEAQLRQQRSTLAGGSLAAVPPPAIEIVFPVATRGGDRINVRLRGATGDEEIVARVASRIGVESVTVATVPVRLGDANLFVVPSDLIARGKPTRIEATDFLGRTASVDLEATAAQSSAVSGATSSEVGDALKSYYALIIGDDDFKFWPKIDNAISDARAIEQELRVHYGFKTTLLIDASREQILSAFNDLRQKLRPDDNLLIYYAGHGQLVRQLDRGYWIPVDAAVNSDAEWILNEQITDYLQIIPARHIILIADSCYAGVLTRSSIERPKAGLDPNIRLDVLRELSAKRVRTVMTSGGIHPVMDSGSKNHSVFAAALLGVLHENDEILEGNRLFDAVSPIVAAQSARLGLKQTPTYRAIVFAGHEGGDFLFIPRLN